MITLRSNKLLFRPLCILCLAALLPGCTWAENDLDKGLAYGSNQERLTRKADERRPAGELPSGINAYLWRAAIDTVGFIPLKTADQKAGLIVTKWYSAPATPEERTQVTIEILDPDLRRDTLRVSVARELKQGDAWIPAPAPALTAQALEERILNKARDLR